MIEMKMLLICFIYDIIFEKVFFQTNELEILIFSGYSSVSKVVSPAVYGGYGHGLGKFQWFTYECISNLANAFVWLLNMLLKC